MSLNNKPNIAVLATGGTIAGKAKSSTQNSYQSGQLTIEDLVCAIPNINEGTNLLPDQLFNLGSQDLDPCHWQQLAVRVKALIADDTVDGVVICHGTDTLEETAWYLQLSIDTPKPIVFTAAMRPATALSADGPLNLFDAINVASAKQSRQTGVLICINQQIFSAVDITKSHTTDVNTFAKGRTLGPIGSVIHGEIRYHCQPKILRPRIFTPTNKPLPKVGIVYGQCGANSEPVEAYIQSQYQGIVVAGVGNGNIHQGLLKALVKAYQKGLSIVRSTRVPFGEVTAGGEIEDDQYGFICSHQLNPQCARILLMLSLACDCNQEQIKSYFNF